MITIKKKVKTTKIGNGFEWKQVQINFVLAKHQAGYSRYEIAKMYKSKFVKENSTRSPDSIKHCISVYGQHIEKDLPRVLFIDVETKPLLAYVWGTYDQNIPLNMLVEHGSILSWCAKFAGENKVHYKDMRGKEKNLKNDKELMKPLWKLMDEASIIIWQNGDKFDYGKINDRFIEHGLGAPSEYKTIDTVKIARRYFKFTSNKLEHMTERFCKKYKKQKHNDFPGFMLWDECMKGNIKAWKSMETYNRLDVLSLEELFLKLAPYVKNNKNVAATLRVYNV